MNFSNQALFQEGLDDLFLSIYISTYIAPLQGNYSQALPAQARPKRRVSLTRLLTKMPYRW